MKHIIAKNDYGEKKTFESWSGKFYDEKDLDQILLLMKKVFQSHTLRRTVLQTIL